MSTNNSFAGAIWTNHALEQLTHRGLSKDLAIETFAHPDKQIKGKRKDTIELRKKFGKSTVTLITSRGNKSEWIVISAWIDPPMEGTKDERERNKWRKYQKSPTWKKIISDIFKQLGSQT